MSELLSIVNGIHRSLSGLPLHTSVLDWLRGLGLTGAKEGCAEGECGACSVLVARPGVDTPTEWISLNSCLIPALTMVGQEIVTAEGLGTVSDMHPVQRELAERGGSQCGYCTPGIVCSMAAEFYRQDRAECDTEDPDRGPNGFDLHALSGNLCRCTGYRPVRDAAYSLTRPSVDDVLAARRHLAPRPVRAEQITNAHARFVRPPNLAEALQLLSDEPHALLVAGATDHGVAVNLHGHRPALTVAIDHLAELRILDVAPDHIEIGAALSLTEIHRRLDGRIPLLDKTIPQFASRLIRNAATIGGNLGTGSPIGDLPPALLALDATVILVSGDGDRAVALHDYFTGYRQTRRRPDELIRSVKIPMPVSEVTAFHKVAKRRFDDISSVSAGFAFQVEDGLITKARIGIGGVAATPLRATATETALEGRPWSMETMVSAGSVMFTQGAPINDHRASARYRRAMLANTLQKLYADQTGGTLA